MVTKERHGENKTKKCIYSRAVAMPRGDMTFTAARRQRRFFFLLLFAVVGEIRVWFGAPDFDAAAK